MTVTNGLITLADLTAFLPNSGSIVTAMAEQAIEAASSAICNYKGHFRPFYPIIQGRTYDIPPGRELDLRADLLECLSITNGDGSAIPSTEYRLEDPNYYPKYAVILKPAAVNYWVESITDGCENAITVNGIWGYHAYYPMAWGVASTISSGISAATTTVAVTSSTLYSAGQIVRCDNELMLVVTVATNSMTVTRAWNGSTASAHDILSTLKVWKTQSDVARACMIQASRYYRRNEAVFGTTGGGEMGAQTISIPGLDPDVEQVIEKFALRF